MNLLSMAAGMMNIFGETMMSKMKRLLAILVLICLLMPISSSAMVRPRPYAIQAASFQSASLEPQFDYTLVPVNVYRCSAASFCRNDPVDFTDPLGLRLEYRQSGRIALSYTGDLLAAIYAKDANGRWVKVKANDVNLDVYNIEADVTLQTSGAMEMVGGAAEAGAGLTYSAGTGGAGAVLGGGAVFLHGVDISYAGFRKLAFCEDDDPYASQAIQSTGIKRGYANMGNSILSVYGVAKVYSVVAAARTAAIAEEMDAALAESAAAAKSATALGRGSTADLAKGTTLARGLREHLAIEEAMSKPTLGDPLRIKMTDPRWPGSEGWVKMQQTIKLGGEPINVHYVRNPLTGEIDDFKIVIQGPRPGN